MLIVFYYRDSRKVKHNKERKQQHLKEIVRNRLNYSKDTR